MTHLECNVFLSNLSANQRQLLNKALDEDKSILNDLTPFEAYQLLLHHEGIVGYDFWLLQLVNAYSNTINCEKNH